MEYDPTKGFIWIDGKIVPWFEATVHVMSHSIYFGSGVWDGIRFYETAKGPVIFRLQDHTDRLFKSAFLMEMGVPFTKDELNKNQCALIRKNQLPSGYIRTLVYYGSEELGFRVSHLKEHAMISTWHIKSYFDSSPDNGIRLQSAIFARNATNSVMSKAKVAGNYVNSLIAYKAAKSAGFDDAFMLDAQGHVSEATTSNIFMVKNNILYTPTTFSIFDGITRTTVMILAKELGYQVFEKDLTRDEFYTADEVFLTGTAAEITAVTEMDGKKIGSGTRGIITKTLSEKYKQVTSGEDKKHLDWLTYV